jgi:predicted nucleotidyltransferase
MSGGLSADATAAIAGVLERYPSVKVATLFGSRAMGRHHPWSDVDLALSGALDDLDVERIALELDELDLPMRFDVVNVASIHNPALRDHVDRVGEVVYRKP